MKSYYWKRALQVILYCSIFGTSFAQYYLRGEIKDENNGAVANAKIQLHSNNYFYYSDTAGSFEILIEGAQDSITISANGYKPLSLHLEAGQYQYIILNASSNAANSNISHLSSLVKNRDNKNIGSAIDENGERHSMMENGFVETAGYPETLFGVNADKLSFNNIRRYININSTVPSDAIRTEELLNFFNLDYREPLPDSNFNFNSYISKCPWNEQNQLLFLHVSAKKIDLDKIPASNIVFLIDATTSMGMPNKLSLLKSAFRFLVNNLREKDTISMVVYGKKASIWLPPTPGSNKEEILKAIEELKAEGAIASDMAIKAAYNIAESQFIEGGNNRIVLATDGEFNIGQSTQEELERIIMTHKRWGIYFSCLGVGMDNLKDEKLHVLAERGGGNMSYINDEKKAEKALMREFAQVDYSVANNAVFNINLDSNILKSYRLIGYDNRLESLHDSNSVVFGGEIGSENSLMTIFELTPKINTVSTEGSTGFTDPNESLGDLRMQYKLPGDSATKQNTYLLQSRVIPFSSLPSTYRFAASVALSAGLLKKSVNFNNAGWNEAINLSLEAYNSNDIFQKEFVGLMEKAKKIYAREKKKKK